VVLQEPLGIFKLRKMQLVLPEILAPTKGLSSISMEKMDAFKRKTVTGMPPVHPRGNMPETFEKNVFINCPFDDDYRQLLGALIFVTKYLGYTPRISLERADSSDSRVQKIVEIIKVSKFGIHDLSRIVSTESDQPFRMNMPFELGIDYGAKLLTETGDWASKKILVLEKEKYRYHKALSDLSGSDIKNHNNDPLELMKVVRNWFLTEDGISPQAPKFIWDQFNYFNAFLSDKLVEKGYELDDVEKIPIPELMMHLDDWIRDNRT
jgi:hypothetical protein